MSKCTNTNQTEIHPKRNPEEQRTYTHPHEVPPIYVDLTLKALAIALLILATTTGLLASAAKWHAVLCSLATVCILALVEFDLYWIHRAERLKEFDALFFVCCGTWVLFLITAGTYLAWTEKAPQLLFVNGGLPAPTVSPTPMFGVAPIIGDFSITFGQTTLEPDGMMREKMLAGIPTPIVVGDKNNSVISLYVKDNRIHCDFNMLVTPDSPIIVRDNRITKPLPFGWDSNSNDEALEVVNAQQEPVFQMYYKAPNAIAINGIFGIANPNSLVNIVDSNGWRVIRRDSPLLSSALKAFKLTRLFKYPGNVFRGVPN